MFHIKLHQFKNLHLWIGFVAKANANWLKSSGKGNKSVYFNKTDMGRVPDVFLGEAPNLAWMEVVLSSTIRQEGTFQDSLPHTFQWGDYEVIYFGD